MKQIIPLYLLLALLLGACQPVTLTAPPSVLQINSTNLSIGAVEGNADQQQLRYEIYLSNTGPDTLYIDWIEPVLASELEQRIPSGSWRLPVGQTLNAGATLPIEGTIVFASDDADKQEITAWEPLMRRVRISAQHEVALPGGQPLEMPDDEDAVSRIPLSIGNLSALAEQITVERFPANEPVDGPWWETYPAHDQIRFDGYVLSETFHEPRIAVYPVQEFMAMSPAAAETIAALQSLLETRPVLADLERLPFLPLFNAGQQIHARATYLTFEGVFGIRYLTQYAQAVNPINNRELFYTFQGITEDGRYYVAALLPVAHPALPDGYEDAPADFAENFEIYLADVVAQLNNADPASFVPALQDLDTTIVSLEIHP